MQVSHQSFISRVCGSLCVACLGVLVFFGSLIVLWWNEGRAVYTAHAIDEAEQYFNEAPCATVNRAYEGQLVHVACQVTNPQYFTEGPSLSVSAYGLWFRRNVEMYQWQQKSSSSTKKDNLGGGQTTTKEYSYEKVWSSTKICEQDFDRASFQRYCQYDCTNYCTSWPLESTTVYARNAKDGVYTIPQDLEAQADHVHYVPLPQHNGRVSTRSGPPAAVTDQNTVTVGNNLYTGDPNSPKIGDMRLSWEVSDPTAVSILARQTTDTFTPWPSHYNPSYTVYWLVDGIVTVSEMAAAQRLSNTMMTWLLRAVGFGACWGGLMMFVGPLSVMPDIIPCIGPIIGDMVGIALCCATCCVATGVSMIVVAIAWLRYRPIAGVICLVIALGLCVGGAYLRKTKGGRKTKKQRLGDGGPDEEQFPHNPAYSPSSSTHPPYGNQSGTGSYGTGQQQNQYGGAPPVYNNQPYGQPPGPTGGYANPPGYSQQGSPPALYPTGYPAGNTPLMPQPPMAGAQRLPQRPSAPPAPPDMFN